LWCLRKPPSQPLACAERRRARGAQVYRARVRETGQEVAVKVQRPGALSTISKARALASV